MVSRNEEELRAARTAAELSNVCTRLENHGGDKREIMALVETAYLIGMRDANEIAAESIRKIHNLKGMADNVGNN